MIEAFAVSLFYLGLRKGNLSLACVTNEVHQEGQQNKTDLESQADSKT